MFGKMTGLVLGGLMFAMPAAAVTFTGSESGGDFELEVTENSGGFQFDLMTVNGTTADFLGLAFDSGLSLGNPQLVSSTGGSSPSLTLFTGTNSCGQGCNFNGRNNNNDFDYVLRIGSQGSGQGNSVASLSFTLDGSGDVSDLFNFFVRAQTVGPNGEQSAKAGLTEVPAVPLPAAGIGLLTGLAGLGLLRRRRRAAV